MRIPLVDLRAQHDELRAELEAVIRDTIDESAFIGGTRVESFERSFAAYCGARHAVACASGTDALKLGLMAAGVGRGDEVITVPNTFIATVEALTALGAYPAFVDVDGPTYHMSPTRLAEFLETQCGRGRDGRLTDLSTGRPVVGVLPVHLYGLPVDMKPILELAELYDLKVVEDACQAHGATYTLDGVEKRVGTLGEAGAFSFFPGKNLGAMGEGGGVTTDDDQMDRNMRVWRDHGQSQRYVHVSPDGWNGRLDALQCAILDVKLKRLDQWNAQRRQVAEWYRQRLEEDDRLTLPREAANRRHVYHLFVIRLDGRDYVHRALTELGIGVGLHYPIPLHLQAAYADMGWKRGDFPESEAAADTILSLPMHPHLTEEQVDHVCASLRRVMRQTLMAAA